MNPELWAIVRDGARLALQSADGYLRVNLGEGSWMCYVVVRQANHTAIYFQAGQDAPKELWLDISWHWTTHSKVERLWLNYLTPERERTIYATAGASSAI